MADDTNSLLFRRKVAGVGSLQRLLSSQWYASLSVSVSMGGGTGGMW